MAAQPSDSHYKSKEEAKLVYLSKMFAQTAQEKFEQDIISKIMKKGIILISELGGKSMRML
ncbi:hypothetical protein DV515_00005265 [Chloebia gouldiae]|uniref:Uncharacterized protein n=1 Tax=Chloebia gouldiae TaxID=44316 RepID=A0A3L8SNK1_CHLGU|nr:hypothetical protein DV515_00005265 [Chloebia gouldiae]